MATYTIIAVHNGVEVLRWLETSQRRACKRARDVVRDMGGMGLDDVYVTEAGGRPVYHLHRIPEGDGRGWYTASI